MPSTSNGSAPRVKEDDRDSQIGSSEIIIDWPWK